MTMTDVASNGLCTRHCDFSSKQPDRCSASCALICTDELTSAKLPSWSVCRSPMGERQSNELMCCALPWSLSTIIIIQIIRCRSKTGTARYDVQPTDDISVLLNKVRRHRESRLANVWCLDILMLALYCGDLDHQRCSRC